ncbi:MAG: Rha family transcriptional regulator [Methylobacter sp.]
MNTQSTPEFRPDLAIINGQIKTTSLKIAEHFGKQHYRVLRAIESLDCSPEFNAANFGVVEYIDAKGEKRPAYEITRDGFTFLAMGFTGKEAAKWKEAYINAFNAMERELLSNSGQMPEQEKLLSDEDWACLFVVHEETQHLITDLKPVLDMLSSIKLNNVYLYLKNLQIVTDKLRNRFGKKMDEAAGKTGMFARKNWRPTPEAEKIKQQATETDRVRILTSFDRGEQPTQQLVPWNSSVIDPDNADQLKTFIHEQVPVERLLDVIDAASKKLAHKLIRQ